MTGVPYRRCWWAIGSPMAGGCLPVQLGERRKVVPGRGLPVALTRALDQGFHGRDESAKAARCCQGRSAGRHAMTQLESGDPARRLTEYYPSWLNSLAGHADRCCCCHA